MKFIGQCRFLFYLFASSQIQCMPSTVDMWNQVDIMPDISMYSTDVNIDRRGAKISLWEEKYCPWWLDFPLGIVPTHERPHFDLHQRGAFSLQVDDDTEARKMAATPFTVSTGESSTKGAIHNKAKGKRLARTNIEVTKDVAPVTKRSRIENLPYRKGQPIRSSTSVHSCVLQADVLAIFDALRKKEPSPEIDTIKSFMIAHEGVGGQKRKGTSTTYSADLILLDMPTGMLVEGFLHIPPWNHWSQDLLEAALGISLAMLDDSGVIVLISSTQHRWETELQVGRHGLQVHDRIHLRGVDPFGSTTDGRQVCSYIDK